MATLLKGAPVAESIRQRSRNLTQELNVSGVTPTLAIVRVGERPDDIAYERSALSQCEKVGLNTQRHLLAADAIQDELLATIAALNDDSNVHGILLFQPLPEGFDQSRCKEAIDPAKDVDALTTTSLASTFIGTGEGFPPCTAQACLEVLDFYSIDIAGKNACVLGRSLVVGKPVAMLLLDRDATVTLCHSKTQDTARIASAADILIAAIGRGKSLSAEYFSAGQVVIDVGINWDSETQSLCGDACFEDAEAIAGAITPVPGGVGTVTTAVLIDHVVQAAWRLNHKS